MAKVKELVEDVLEKEPEVLPGSKIYFVNILDANFKCLITANIQDIRTRNLVIDKLNAEIANRFQKAGLEFSEPNIRTNL
jgi:small-conductance mechanosensitive channel